MKDKEIEDLLNQLFRQAQMQFGTAVKGAGCTTAIVVRAAGKKSP